MFRPFLICCVAIFVVIAPACSRRANETKGPVVEPYVLGSGSIAFDIEPVQSRDGWLQWKATYASQGKTARFRIELGPERPVEAKEGKDFSFRTGEGRFVAEAGSDASALLVELKKALEAKALPTKVQRSASLPFTFVNLGDKLSQDSAGGFNTRPPGNWTAMKIFVGGGEEEGEVFLNFNRAIGKGQFSIKDADCGDIVLAELAKVL